MKKKLIIVLIILIIILGGVYAWHKFIAYETAKFLKHYGQPTFTVNVVKPKKATWHTQLQAVGSTIASQGVNVNSEADGQITHIFFKSGERVQKGQRLLQLNPKILKAQLANDRANLHYAKISYERQLKLVKESASTKAELDKALAQYKQDLARVAQTKAQLQQRLIKAPFAGLLGIRQVNLGEYLTAGKTIVSLQALQPMYMDFNLPENTATLVKKGYSVSMSTVAYPNRQFSGKIIAINSTFANNTRSLEVRAALDNTDNALLPGMFAQVLVSLPKAFSVITIPQIAVNYASSGDYVYVVKNHIAKRQYISLGERRADVVQVTKGLSLQDAVVYAGQVKLRNGAKVTIKP